MQVATILLGLLSYWQYQTVEYLHLLRDGFLGDHCVSKKPGILSCSVVAVLSCSHNLLAFGIFIFRRDSNQTPDSFCVKCPTLAKRFVEFRDARQMARDEYAD